MIVFFNADDIKIRSGFTFCRVFSKAHSIHVIIFMRGGSQAMKGNKPNFINSPRGMKRSKRSIKVIREENKYNEDPIICTQKYLAKASDIKIILLPKSGINPKRDNSKEIQLIR